MGTYRSNVWNKETEAAENVLLIDSGDYYLDDNVEGALQEVGGDITTIESDKLAKSDPTVDAEVKTMKLHNTGDSAALRGEGTVKYNDTADQLEVSNGADWIPVGTGDDTMGFRYDNPNMEVNIDGYNTYDDGAVSEPVDGTGGTPTVITVAAEETTPLIGVRSLKVSKSALDGQGEGVSYDFEIDRGQLEGTVEFKFNYETSVNYVSDDMGFYLYDIDNSQLMYPSIVNIPTTGGQPAEFFCTFIPSNSLNYRAIWHVQSTNALAYDVLIDNVQVGKFNTAIGAAIGEWQEYDLEIVGSTSNPTKGGATVDKASWRRVGSNVEIKYRYRQTSAGSAGNGLYYFSLPEGLQADDKVIDTVVGSAMASNNSDELNATTKLGVARVNLAGTGVYLQLQDDLALNESNIVSNLYFPLSNPFAIYSFEVSIPISQWTSNINLASDSTEYASNSDMGDNNSSEANTYYGIEGSPLPTVDYTTNRDKKIKFRRHKQIGDRISLEFIDAFGNQVDYDYAVYLNGSSGTGLINNNGKDGFGITYWWEDDIVLNLRFFPVRTGTSGWDTFAGGGRYRVRKVSNGNMAEVPPLVRLVAHTNNSYIGGTNPIIWSVKQEDTHDIYDETTGKAVIPLDGVYQSEISFILAADTGDYDTYLQNETKSIFVLQGQPRGVGAVFGSSVPTKSERFSKGDVVFTRCGRSLPAGSSTYRWTLTRIGN